jgi:hypothetical protein
MSNTEHDGKTNIAVLHEIANKDTISEFEEKFMRFWAYEIGFKRAVVVCGLIYPEGQGRAYSLNYFAKLVIKYFEDVEKVEK